MRTMSLVVVFACVLFYLGMNDFGGGVDGGIHYGMADTLATQFVWPYPKTIYFAGITYYPPGAHLLAAGLGWIAGSTLHGIFIVTAISFALFYIVVADLLKGDSNRRTLTHFVIFVILVIALRKFRFVAGNEVSGNFFFAHFAGNAVLMAGFYLAYRTIARPLATWLIICAVAVHVTGWFFPLSAVELAIAAAVLRLAPLTDVRSNTRRRVIEAAISVAVLCAVAIVHPTIRDMVGISGNNGGITIADTTIIWIVIGSIVVGLAWFWLFNGSRVVRTEALFALNIGALAPCVALVVLNILGIGSLYAAKKSGFLLGTVVLMMVSVLIAEISSRVVQRNGMRLATLFEPSRLQIQLASSVFVVAVMLCVFAGRENESIDSLKSFDRNVRELLVQTGPDKLDGVTMLARSTVSPHVNYLIGFALLKPIAAAVAQQYVFDGIKSKIGGAKFAIVDAGDRARYEPGCVLQSSESLMVVTSQCLAVRLQ